MWYTLVHLYYEICHKILITSRFNPGKVLEYCLVLMCIIYHHHHHHHHHRWGEPCRTVHILHYLLCNLRGCASSADPFLLCWVKGCGLVVNSLRAKFCRGNINIYLHFISLLHIDMTQVLKILPQVRPGPTYSTLSISWLLMSCISSYDIDLVKPR